MRIAILCEKGFEAMELMYPYYRLLEEGFIVDIVAPEKKEYTAYNGYTVKTDTTLQRALQREYNCVVIPGGKAPLKLAKNKQVLSLISNVAKKGGIIAAICHGPLVLSVLPNLINGVTLTGYPKIKEALLDAGVHEFVNEPVVIDINTGYILVTSRTPKDLPQFGFSLVELLRLEQK